MKRSLSMAAAMALAAVLAAGCTTAPEAQAPETPQVTPGVIDKTFDGTTIDVMLPPWGGVTKDELADFTERTGITVNLQELEWDAIHDKIVTAAASGQAVADVVDMDWTWVAQFGAAGWFVDLRDWLAPTTIEESLPRKVFEFEGAQLGLPYLLDIRGTQWNVTKAAKAGITEPPSSWADLLQACATLQQTGVDAHPVAMSLAAREDTATAWYGLIRASGGNVLGPDGEAAFLDGDIGLKALQLLADFYTNGCTDPGAIALTGAEVTELWHAGQGTLILSSSPPNADNPEESVPANDDRILIPTPSLTGEPGPVIGLPEALAIPSASTKKAAAAMFITWRMETPQLIAAYHNEDAGLLPPTQAGLDALDQSGELFAAESVMAVGGNVESIFPGGAPLWYGKFSAAAATMINTVVSGGMTPQQGIDDLAKQTETFAAE